MFSPQKYMISCVIIFIINSQLCSSEVVLGQSLVLYSPGEPEYLDVLVRRVNDNLTLVCELRGDMSHRHFVWNYVASNQSLVGTGVNGDRPFQISPVGPFSSSTLQRPGLQVADSGHYMCSVPPFSVTKYIAVQIRGPVPCARGAFTCGARCVLPAYVCDGRGDCLRAEDEAAHMCTPRICSRPDKLNCSSGRCISASACCRGAAPLCQQPACCDEYTRQTPVDGGGLIEAEFPPLFEDRRAPDDYGFIQSTIYTVTACALIFMIAVVLLVSAICKMQMKRAALRGYTHADRAARHHYSVQYHQAHSFPPCYEASRLLEQDGITVSPSRSPTHLPTEADIQHVPAPEPAVVAPPRGLARLSAIFSSRYRQVPTHPDVEMTSVPPSSLPPSPSHSPPLPLDYRSPTFCDLNTELIFTPEEMGRELNYMATPVEFFRRRTMRRNTLERVMDQIDRQRLTLQLGRFQLSIPRLGRAEPRPDTPVAEPRATIHSLRIDARDTYTLNGRTIRLLGADIQHSVGNPPSYTEAVRYKLYGPPPEYLSREGLNQQSSDVDQEAASNVEMPPRYDDLGNNDVNGNNSGVSGNNGGVSGNNNGVSGNNSGVSGNNNGVMVNSVSGNIATSEGTSVCVNANASGYQENGVGVSGNNDSVNGNDGVYGNCDAVNGNGSVMQDTASAVVENGNNVRNASFQHGARLETSNLNMEASDSNAVTSNSNAQMSNSNLETLSSIIDNLPAIDSDVNANDGDTGVNNDHVLRDNVNVIAN